MKEIESGSSDNSEQSVERIVHEGTVHMGDGVYFPDGTFNTKEREDRVRFLSEALERAQNASPDAIAWQMNRQGGFLGQMLDADSLAGHFQATADAIEQLIRNNGPTPLE